MSGKAEGLKGEQTGEDSEASPVHSQHPPRGCRLGQRTLRNQETPGHPRSLSVSAMAGGGG